MGTLLVFWKPESGIYTRQDKRERTVELYFERDLACPQQGFQLKPPYNIYTSSAQR